MTIHLFSRIEFAGSALLTVALTIIILFFAFQVVFPAYAADITISSDATLTDLTVAAGDQLIVESDVSLRLEGTTNLLGSILNSGEIINAGEIIDHGGISNNHNGLLVNLEGATITTDHTIGNNGVLANNGTITSYDAVVTKGVILNDVNAVIYNFGTIINNSTGPFPNGGVINNFEGGVIINRGTDLAYNVGTIINHGEFNNTENGEYRIFPGGVFNNTDGGVLDNHGVIAIQGTINILNGSTLNNFGNIGDSGILLRECGSTINNLGTISSIFIDLCDIFALGLPINVSNSSDQFRIENDYLTVLDNNIFVLWGKTPQNSADNHIYFVRSTDGGSTFESSVELGIGFSPKVAVVDANHIYVVWQSGFTGGDTFFTGSTDGGSTFSEPMNLSLLGSAVGPAVAGSGNNVYVAWEDHSLIDYEIFVRISHDGGQTFEDAFNISNDEILNSNAEIAAFADKVHIGWTSQGSPSTDAFIISSHDSGATFGNPFKLSASGFSQLPVIAPNNENLYVAFNDLGESHTPNIAFRVSHDGGVTFEDRIFITHSFQVGTVPPPTIEVTDENIYVGWVESGFSGNGDAFYSVSANGGASFSEPVNLSSNFERSSLPSIRADGDFTFVAWNENNNLPGTSKGVARASPNNGQGFTPPLNLTDSGSANGVLIDSIESKLFVTYIDGFADESDIYFRTVHFNSDNDITPPNVSVTLVTDGEGKELNNGEDTSSEFIQFVFESSDNLLITQVSTCLLDTPSGIMNFGHCTSPLGVSLSEEGPYQLEVKTADRYGNLGTATFDLIYQRVLPILSVSTDKPEYSEGEEFLVSGSVGETPSSTVLIEVFDPAGNTDRIEEIFPESNGAFGISFVAGGLMNTEGTYTVRASYNGLAAETTFEFVFSDNLLFCGREVGQYDNAILGSAGSDNLLGSSNDDLIKGFGGDDTIDGRGGDDCIAGHGGDDTLLGGPGDDSIYGGIGDDEIRGNDGDDTLYGNDGDDFVSGGGGDDYIAGKSGNDSIFGNNGSDKLFGNDGDDFLKGGDGDDIIFGGEGHDVLLGNTGADRLSGQEDEDALVGGRGNDRLRGGEGIDGIDGGRDHDISYDDANNYDVLSPIHCEEQIIV